MTLDTRNPLLQPWPAPDGLPPFAEVRAQHFKPAFEAALAEHRAEIEAIAANTEAPGFDNTIAALDRAGRGLARVDAVFHNLGASHTSPELQAAERELAAPLAAHGSEVYMNARLFARVDAVHARREALGLSAEERRLVERIHLDFVRAGARIAAADRERYARNVRRLAELHTRFAQNVLADESAYRLVLRDEGDLAGLPGFVRAAARQAAAERGVADAHVITLSRSLVVPFLTFSERRDLREQAWRAWVSRGEHEGPHDNRPVAREVLSLRLEQAQLHGYACFADYVLADTMAGTRQAVDELLQQVWAPAARRAAEEERDLAGLAPAHGVTGRIEAWDWRYLAEKLRQERFDVDEAAVKPYFPLDRMVEAAFDCAHRLFGLRFVPHADLQAYHPDVKVYEVQQEGDAEPIGLFLHDNFARPTKRSGAWMSLYRAQSRDAAGKRVPPIVANNNNFAKGAPGEPTLLSFDDARTLFHEFGHGLHGLLSNVAHERLSCTNVMRDFVELPSQLFEHWLGEREVLKRHARHHATGEPIPDELVSRLEAANRFNQGYETLRYLASARVDMAIHSRTGGEAPDVVAFERAEVERMGLPAAVGMNHRLPHFLHLFAGSGYAAGYYVYLWAEVLDADGYDAFTEAGDPFDAKVARRLREHIYASGNSRDPREAYRAFRGHDPQVQPMLRERGLLEGLLEDVGPV